MKLKEAIALITHDYAKGIPSDDSRLRPRRVYSALKNARARILEDRKATSEYNYNILPCVELEQTTASECSCVPVQGCKYYKTKCQLPAGIGSYDSSIRDVTTIDGNIRFSKIDWSRVGYSSYDKYTAVRPRYYIRNGYLYLIHVPKRLKVITIRGMFEDPVGIDCFMCGTDDCSSYQDRDFPIERKYVGPVMQLAYEQLFALNTVEDKVNNNEEGNGQ